MSETIIKEGTELVLNKEGADEMNYWTQNGTEGFRPECRLTPQEVKDVFVTEGDIVIAVETSSIPFCVKKGLDPKEVKFWTALGALHFTIKEN